VAALYLEFDLASVLDAEVAVLAQSRRSFEADVDFLCCKREKRILRNLKLIGD
jgi:hypothetical protein